MKFGVTVDHCTTQLIVMAKSGRPGQAKTRLARSVGDALAAEFQRVSLVTLLKRMANVGDHRKLALWPPEDVPWIERLAADFGWSTTGQVAGDLGQKMSDQFTAAFASGHNHVVMIGADSPQLEVATVQQALVALQAFDYVIGPCADGGYYLIGGRSSMPPEIFADMQWGTNRLFQQTCDRLRLRQRRFATLPVEFDVDRIQDVQRLLDLLSGPDYRDDIWDELRNVCRACVVSGKCT